MSSMILAWCPGQDDPCDPCKKPITPPPSQSGYPPWNTLAYDGVLDLRFLYSAVYHGQVVSPPGGGLWGGHTVTFGPHAGADPGIWMQPPYQVQDTTYTYWAASSSLVGTAQTQFPDLPVAGTDPATVQEADRTAQWAAYNYLVAH